jgi:ligand-binding sensor domain-containing protein/two-component sensor histidine kinase
MRKRLPILLFFLLPLFVCAQKLFLTTYTENDGLVNNAVRAIFQDSKGFLWISTWEGLSKYDGHHFTNFTEGNGLSHNLVNDVLETKTGDTYVAMNDGSVDIIRNDQVVQKGIVKNIIINKLQLTQQGKLLALTDNNGLFEINGRKIRQIANTRDISFYGLINLNDSLLAAATFPLPIFIYDGQFQIKAFSKSGWPHILSNCIYKDAQNRIWLGTNEGLKLISGFAGRPHLDFQNLPVPFNTSALTKTNITSIFQQQNGNFWIGTDQGLINVRPDGQEIQFTEKDGLPSSSVTCIFNDRENNLWIGTTLGLTKIVAPTPVPIHFSFQEKPDAAVLLKKLCDTQALISSEGLVFKYDLSSGKTKKILQYKAREDFVYVTNSNPFLFVYQKQLQSFDSELTHLHPISSLPPADNFFSATTTNNQTIFIGSTNGIKIYVHRKAKNDSTFSMRINNVLADKKGYVWIGTWTNGLYRCKYDEANERWSEIIHLPKFPDEHIRSLFEDKNGSILAGTRYNGVVKILEKDAHHFDYSLWNQQTGLSSNWVRDIAEDEKGNIWLVTMSGVDKLLVGNTFKVFNYSRVVHFITNANLITHIKGDTLLCSSVHGVFQLTDKDVEQISPVPVYLTKIDLGNSEKPLLSNLSTSQKIILPYSNNHLSFEFTSPVYLNEKEILYSYRLEGSGDTTWSKPSNSHSVEYASLEPGHYQFEVRMLGWNGNYGPTTSFLFSVKPPYWRTWWFYALCLVAVVLILFAFYKYRINQLLKLQNVRNRIATDLHDDIGSTLTNISILSELSHKNLQQPVEAEKYLKRINEEINSSGQALDDIIWSINTSNDSLEEMIVRMRRFAAELFDNSNTQCHLELHPSAIGKKLNMEQRRDLYLIFKESLNNIYKHASAKTVQVDLSVVSQAVKLSIKDDGRGFNPNIATHRNGLKNLQARVAKWKGTIILDTQPGQGTLIKITMPVKFHYSNE